MRMDPSYPPQSWRAFTLTALPHRRSSISSLDIHVAVHSPPPQKKKHNGVCAFESLPRSPLPACSGRSRSQIAFCGLECMQIHPGKKVHSAPQRGEDGRIAADKIIHSVNTCNFTNSKWFGTRSALFRRPPRVSAQDGSSCTNGSEQIQRMTEIATEVTGRH